jgi:endonuclease G, mitochondrial
MRLALILALAAGFSSHAHAAFNCPQHFYDGQPPDVVGATGEAPVFELCSSAFATLWVPVTRDPVYSAEHLTPQGLMHAKDVKRVDAFHADPRLPVKGRAALADYKGGAYDRGHLAPDHDMPDDDAVRESFALSNMVPQDPTNNRGPWAQIEEATRDLVVSVVGGPGGWVVTGPAFNGQPRLLRDRVAIPDRLFKAVYIPAKPELHNDLVVGAWIVKNAADPQTRFVSLDTLKAETGVDPFPSLSAELHAAVALPAAARKRTLP